jgi:hypothetical protein
VADNADPELAAIVRALESTVRAGGEADVRIGRSAAVRVRLEEGTTGMRMRATATALPPAVARELEVLGWRALERRVFRSPAAPRRRGSTRVTGDRDRTEAIVDDVSRTWPIVATRDVDAVALDVLDAVDVIAGPDAVGAVVARHVPLGDEDSQYLAIGAVLGGLSIVIATLVAAGIRVAAAYPLDLLGSLLIPIVGGAVVSFIASRLVLGVFGHVRGLRSQAEPTALVVGAVAPAVAIVAYTAAAIRLGLP